MLVSTMASTISSWNISKDRPFVTCAIYYTFNEPFRQGEQYQSGGTTRPPDHERYGALRAIDPLTGDRKWEFRYPTGSSSGVLTTASGLVFSGDGDGNIIALDSRSGKNSGITSSAWAFGLRAERPTWSTAASISSRRPATR
jgi:outer membrane protein assembly factor BamB